MIDEKKLLKDLQDAMSIERLDDFPIDYFKFSELKGLISIREKEDNNKWIPCSERLPEAEKEVELSIKRITDSGIYYFTVRGFYEDGNIWNDESFCCWEYDKDVHDYDDERDDFKISESWWEKSEYGDEYSIYMIDDFVTAWRELPEPYKEDK